MSYNGVLGPIRFDITVKFKPDGIDPDKAKNTKEVTFTTSHKKKKQECYDIAMEKAISRDIINKHGIKYWEPYDISISAMQLKNSDPIGHPDPSK